MIIRKGDYFKVRTFFKYDGNSFFKGNLLRIVSDFSVEEDGFCTVSNKAWQGTSIGHTDTENQYSFGKGTNWNIPINFIEEQCIPVSFEWE